MEKQQFVLVYGGLVDGLFFVGPYNTAEEANEHAKSELKLMKWEVAELFMPPIEAGSTLFRVVAPKAGGDPAFQFWLNDGEDGEPNLRPDYQVLTNWTAF